MWPVIGNPVPASWLSLQPVRVLYDFDGPLIFICQDVPGNTYLAYQCGRDRGTLRYLVVPCDPGLEQQLTHGHVNVRDALTQQQAWLFDLSYDWHPAAAWEVDVDDLLDSALPRPGVMLWPDLKPVIQYTPRRASKETKVTPSYAERFTQPLIPVGV